MVQYIVNALTIAVIIALIFGSGFVQDMERIVNAVWHKYAKSPGTFRLPKPFGCMYCMVFWTVSIYLCISSHQILMPVLIGLLCAEFSTFVSPVVELVKHFVMDIIVWLDSMLSK